MSLSANDLNEIRNIVDSAIDKQSRELIRPIQDELHALRSDVEEIYGMIFDLKRSVISDKSFEKLSLEKKILIIHSELMSAAKQAGIKLPSH